MINAPKRIKMVQLKTLLENRYSYDTSQRASEKNKLICRILGINSDTLLGKNRYTQKQAGKKLPILVSAQWISGGVTGGNCWGDEANISREAEDTPEFNELFDFLTEHYPNISFLQARAILLKTQIGDYTELEYYGNCTHYGIHYIMHDDLIEVLSNL